MGQGFTHRLIEKGHKVIGFDIDAGQDHGRGGLGRHTGKERCGSRQRR